MTLKSYAQTASDFASINKAIAEARKVIRNTRELAAQHGNSAEILETVRPLEELIGYHEVAPGTVSATEVRAALDKVNTVSV